jgi:hypothetical protein
MISPSQTGGRLHRFNTWLGEPISGESDLPDERLRQEFFVEWEVPQTPAASESDYDRGPALPVDLRGTGALLVGDFDVRAG